MTLVSIEHNNQPPDNYNTFPQIIEVLKHVYGRLDNAGTSAKGGGVASTLQGCLPLLMEQVSAESLIQQVGEKKYEQMRYLYRHISILNLWYTLELKYILDAMAAAQIRVMILKGADIASSLYSRPELRPFNDIDLMVQPEDLAATIAIFEKLGYHYHQEYRFEAISRQRAAFVYIKRVPTDYLVFEIHTSPHHNELGVTFEAVELWKRARPITVAGMSASGMGLEDLLLYLCWHCRSHVFGRLIWLYDIALLLLHFADQLDWVLARQLAREQGLMATVYYCVRWCEQLFHIALPKVVPIEQFMPPVFIQRLIRRLVGDDLTSVLHRSAERERKLLQYLMVDSVSALCLVGWHILFPSPTHLGRLYMEHSRLPLHLFWLYYPLRPLFALRALFGDHLYKKGTHE